jgi:hypothetical protein
MKRAVAVLAVLSALGGFAGSTHALTLQEGWYAWFGGVYAQVTYYPSGESYYAFWQPTTSLGQYGPVTVGLWEGYSSTRRVTVPADASVSPGVLFEDAGSFSGLDREFSELYINWETDYDATKMRLQLFRRRAGQADHLLWEQAASGHRVADGTPMVDYPILVPGDGLTFSIAALPEPASVTGLACGIGLLALRSRRRGA